MRSDDIAALMTAGMAQHAYSQESSYLGFHQGVLTSFDEQSGLNTVVINGQPFANLRVLTTGAGITFTQGDTVAILRFQTTYFILGRVAAPGAGASLGVRVASWGVHEGAATDANSFVDLDPYGPELAGIYVSSARRALVWVSALVNATGSLAFAGVRVTGASDIEPTEFQALASGGWVSASRALVFTAESGLNEGHNTFRLQYRVAAGEAISEFRNAQIIVMPF